MHSRTALCIILLLFASVTAGCPERRRADYSSLGLVDVSGRVTLDGQPLAGASVCFEAEDRTFSQGQTDTAGRYRLMYNSEQAGVTPGRKTIRIRTAVATVGEAAAPTEDHPAAPAPPRERLPACYNTASTLHVEVTPARRTFDFPLQSRP